MSHRRIHFYVAVFAVFLHPFVLAAPTTSPAKLADRVALILKQLDSDSYQEREAAVEAAGQLPLEALPLLQAEAKKPGVSPEVRSRLEAIIKNLKVGEGKKSKYESALAFYRSHLAGEYDRVGKHNPKWDDTAQKLMEEVAKGFADDFTGRDGEHDMKQFLAPLKASKCDDPLVLYLQFRAGRPPVMKEVEAMHKAMMSSGYSAFRKLNVLAWMSENPIYSADEQDRKKKMLDYFNSSLDLWGDALKAEPDMPTDIVIRLLTAAMERSEKLHFSRKSTWDRIDASLAKAFPEESLLRLYIKGQFLIEYAWDARGGGWASSVTEDGWKEFGNRLSQAEKVLTRCYELFPNDPHAPTKMITVELGQGQERDHMELWFSRAMKADPGNVAACRAKMYYLEPKWHGSREEQLEFGKQCLAGGQFDTSIPLMVVDAHHDSAPPPPWGSALENPYFAREDVWSDISAAYEGFLSQHPHAHGARHWYADYAYKAGKWEIADKQFSLVTATSYKTPDDNMMLPLKRAEIQYYLKSGPPKDMRATIIAMHRKDVDDLKKLTVQAYDAVGNMNPKWDAPAREALTAAAMEWGEDPERKFNEKETMLVASRKALDAGCDDPLIRFIYSNSVDSYVTARDKTFKATCLDDALRVLDSKYPNYIRIMAVGWGTSFELFPKPPADPKRRETIEKALNTAIDDLQKCVEEKSVRDTLLFALSDELLTQCLAAGMVPEEITRRIEKSFTEGKASESTMAHLKPALAVNIVRFKKTKLAGKPYVAKEQLPIRDTADQARKQLVALWLEDINDQVAIQYILRLTMFQPMSFSWEDFWFRQALRLDPADYQMAELALHRPNYTGSSRNTPAEFAEQCAEMADYRSQIPFLQVVYLDKMARQNKPDAEKPDGEILGDFENWPKVSAVYEAYLTQFPLDVDRRSEYASYACLVGRWPLAAEQFKILGNRIRPRAFYTQSRLDACRNHINELMGKGFLPESNPAEK